MITEHTPTPWKTVFNKRLGWWVIHHLQPCERGDTSTLFTVHTSLNEKQDEANAAFIVKAVNSHAALVELAEKIAEQDEFTHSEGTPQSVKQAYAIINTWRNRASAALKLAKES